jgi:anthranilate phosphoribosyltransferase
MRECLEKLQQKRNLSHGEMLAAMTEIMTGQASEFDIRDFLLLLNAKGPSVTEITAAAQIMRKHVLKVETERDVVLDTCGTGGDAMLTFNISTATALVVAACGVAVAKHGNRSVSSRCGSADVLESLGVRITLPQEKVRLCLQEAGIAFLFAQNHHPAMKNVAAVRKSIGAKTIFNILGPLTNPAMATHQMMGVYSLHLAEQMANVLKNLGARRAVVAHGADGLDEITTTHLTSLSVLDQGLVASYQITPEDYKIERASPDDLKGGDVRDNADIILDILKGRRGPKRDVVLLNSAFALYAAEKVFSPRDGLVMAAQAIDQGWAMKKLEVLKEFTNRA